MTSADTAEPERLQARFEEAFAAERYEQSEAIARELIAVLIERRGDQDFEVARAYAMLGKAFHSQTRHVEADSMFAMAIETCGATAGHDHELVADALLQRAIIAMDESRIEEADGYYVEAIEIRRRIMGEHLQTYDAIALYGDYLRFQGKLVAADSVLTVAMEGMRRLDPDALETAYTEHRLALTKVRLGDLVEAERLTRSGLEVIRRELGPNHTHVGVALGRLAHIRYRQGDYAEAAEIWAEALAIFLTTFDEAHRWVITVSHNVAKARARAGELEAAEAFAVEITERIRRTQGDVSAQLGSVLTELGWNLTQQGRYDDADSVLAEALAVKRATVGDGNQWVSTIMHYQADLAILRSDYARADSLFEVLRGRYERERGRIDERVMRVNVGQAVIATAGGDYPAAEALLIEARDIFETLRLKAGRGRARATFADPPYELLAAVYLELNKPEHAWSAVEHSRGLTLADLILATNLRPLSDAEKAQEQILADAIDHREAKVREASADCIADDTETNGAALRLARQELLSAQSDWFAFQDEIATRYPVLEGRTLSLEQVQSTMNPADAIVGWLDVWLNTEERALWGYVVRNTGPVRWERLPQPADRRTGEAIIALRKTLEPQTESVLGSSILDDSFAHAAGAVYRERFAPLEPHLQGADRITVVPSTEMASIPLDVLVDESRAFMGDRFSIVYAPSASIMSRLISSREAFQATDHANAILVGDSPYKETHLAALNPLEDGMLVASSVESKTLRNAMLGDPNALGDLPRLRWSRHEVMTVGALFDDPDLLLGADACESAIRSRSRDGRLAAADVIHIAAHAIVDERRPERSALILAQVQSDGSPLPEGDDGRLTAEEVVRHWDLSADLVVLSACRSALGRSTSEGTQGLASAFLQSGSRCLLVSLWNVDDQATALLMQRFYENWIGGQMSRRGALQQAKHWLRTVESEPNVRKWEHPRYWSAFVLVGDAD